MDPNRQRHAAVNWRAYLLLTITALCWGGNAVFGRLAVGEISPMLLVTLRWFGVLLLLVIFANRYIRRDWCVLRGHLLFVGAMGALGFTAFNALFYVAAHSTTAVNIGIIQGAIPVFVIVGVFVAYRTPVTALRTGGIVLTMLGVAYVASGGDLTRLAGMAANHGDLLMIVACVFYAGYAVGLRQHPAVSSLGLFTAIAGAAFLASIPLAAIEAALGGLQWPSTTGWVIVALVTLFPSLLAQMFFIEGTKLIGPSRAGLFVNLVPVFASGLAVIFLKEQFHPHHAGALGLVLGGIWLSERGGRSG